MTTSARRLVAPLIVLVAWGLVACAGRQRRARTAADTCAAEPSPLARTTPVDSMGGTYRLRMVEMSGGVAGQRVDGELVLRPQRDDLVNRAPGVQMPWRGEARLALEDVGALRLGDLTSQEPSAPGVGVHVTRDSTGGVTSLVLRLGPAANSTGPSPFDAAFTVLYVRRVSGGGIWGGWQSSSGMGIGSQQAEGFFCAIREIPG